MDRCASCGAALAAGASWCGQCYGSVATRQVADSGGLAASQTVTEVRPFGWRPVPSLEDLPAPVRRTRWRKTPTTFGPFGRVACTIGLIVPFLIMLVGGIVADPFALGGAFIWGAIIMPWALKDIWRAGQLPSRS